MAENGNSNGNGNSINKVIWWILTGLAGLTFLGLQLVLGRIDGIDVHQREDAIAVTRLQTQSAQTEVFMTQFRGDQMKVILAAADMQTKVSNQDIALKILDERTKTMTDRILSLAQRLDRLGSSREPGMLPPGGWSAEGSPRPHPPFTPRGEDLPN